jgi:hypothetical protein
MDLTGWLEYFVAGLSTQLQEMKARGERAIRAEWLPASTSSRHARLPS